MNQPHDLAAEQAVLGAMLISPTVCEAIIDLLGPEDFYRPGHATIFRHLLDAWANDRPTDAVTILAELTAAGELGRAGGGGYLHDLIASVPTAANAPWYARIVAEHARRRRLAEAAVRIHALAVDDQRPVDQAVDAAQAELHAATAERRAGEPADMTSVIDAALDRAARGEEARGISTGLGVLDDAIGGLKPGQFVVVGGRPGAGKSVLVCDIARSAAVRRSVPTLLFSLEMTRAEVGARILAATCEVNLTALLHGHLRPEQQWKLRNSRERLVTSPLHVDDSAQLDIGAIRATARRHAQRRAGLGLVIVDYLQLIGSRQRRDSRVQEVGEFSTALKTLARELAVPVVAAAQLNRASEIRTDKRPQLSDLRESGQIEADADVVILLHRPDQNDRSSNRPGEVDLILAKNRHGPTTVVTAVAQLEFARFVDMEFS